MPHFDPAEFGHLLAGLTPHELRQAEGLVAEARERAEAVLEIDARAEAGGAATSCPRCGAAKRSRWGRTRTGAQRWRCSGCRSTWSGRSGTPLARMHRPDLVAALVRDMIEAPQPMSCRRAAAVLGASHHSIRRWRMAIIGALKPELDDTGRRAHDILHWVHRVFSNMKPWAKGLFHGLRKRHLQRYLDEFVFRWNRRRHMRGAFDTLLWAGVDLEPATYRDFVDQRV